MLPNGVARTTHSIRPGDQPVAIVNPPFRILRRNGRQQSFFLSSHLPLWLRFGCNHPTSKVVVATLILPILFNPRPETRDARNPKPTGYLTIS